MKAVHYEFRAPHGKGLSFHPECVAHIKLIRDAFLLLSLLRVVHLDRDQWGKLPWATNIPQSLAWISFDYQPLTTARCLLFPKTEKGDLQEFKICGDCFTIWISNIRDLWDETLDMIGCAMGAKVLPQGPIVRHAVNNLLKHDPCPNPEKCCEHALE